MFTSYIEITVFLQYLVHEQNARTAELIIHPCGPVCKFFLNTRRRPLPGENGIQMLNQMSGETAPDVSGMYRRKLSCSGHPGASVPSMDAPGADGPSMGTPAQ